VGSSFGTDLTKVTAVFSNMPQGFDFHGSVHLGNVYVQLKVQLDVLFTSILYSSLFFALHISGAIYTHPQEHEL
jgi:hypothetical protein